MVEAPYESSPARLDELIRESWDIVRRGIDEHVLADGRSVAAICVLYSGGNDSTTLAHLFRNVANYAVHCNTTIGIARTRAFVQETCEGWGLPLLIEEPPKGYDELVVEAGFPGPAMHFKMFHRLKERALRVAQRKLVSNPRRERVVYLAGRRRSESARRSEVPEMERDGSAVWISPLVDWRKEDLELYRKLNGVPENPVSAELGMSGECLCGAFAEPGEYERVAEVDHDVALQIFELEAKVREAWSNPRPWNRADHAAALRRARAAHLRGSRFMVHRHLATAARIRQRIDRPRFPEHACQWGWGAYKADPSRQRPKSGPMCSSCDARWQPAPAPVSDNLARILAKRVRA